MINAAQVEEILKQYKKHGWTLRRVLLCAQTQEILQNSLETLFYETPVVSSETDAVWFSRASAGGDETWELRRLSASPFALVEVFHADDDEDVREEARYEMEKVVSGK